MKKRALSLALAAAMAVSLAGCGSSSSGTADKPAETKSAEGGAQDTGAEEAASDWKWERNVEIICPGYRRRSRHHTPDICFRS